MNFLANENFPLVSINRLRNTNHDVASVLEDSSGAKDHEVLTRAQRENRIILTFDRDYGELLYREQLSAPSGIVYFRFDPVTPLEPTAILLELLATEGISLSGKFTVVERKGMRQRSLPAKK
jgi:predicted nuclease of predicted toxin-antitoxin system